MNKNDVILDVNDLEVKFYQDIGIVNAVNGVTFQLKKGKAIGIVGESGCGKTVSAYSTLSLLPPGGKITSGEILYKKRDNSIIDITKLDPDGDEIRRIRGRDISIIFQEPMTALSPVHTIYDQISEMINLHLDMTAAETRERVIELLRLVGIPAPAQRVDDYAFQLSGGMRQRVMIAMALASNPRILIADEPTTALDVTIQAQVLKLIKDMQKKFNLSLILITHDLGVVAHMVDFVYVMYLGQAVESGPVEEVLVEPHHPYSRDLLKSIPRIKGPRTSRIDSIEGTVPDTYYLPSGCPFHTRCNNITGEICKLEKPSRIKINKDHYVNCFIYNEKRDEGGEVDEQLTNV